MAKKYNCEKNGVQYYRVTKTINGERKEFYGDGKREAEDKRDEYVRRVEAEEAEKQDLRDRGYDPAYKDVTFGDGIHKWVYNIKRLQCKKHSTFARYELAYRNQVKECGCCERCTLLTSPIFSVKRKTMKDCINAIEDNDHKSYGNIEWFITITKMYFEYLIDESIIPNSNPCRKLAPTKKQPPEKTETIPFTGDEKKQFSDALLGEPEHYQLAHILDFNTGLRQAELVALEWSDVEWGKGIWVKRTASYTKVFESEHEYTRKLVFQLPKGNKTRFAAIPDYLWPILKAHKKNQAAYFMEKGLGRPVYIISDEQGKMILPKRIRRAFEQIQKKSGIKDRKKFHDIRHTYITDMAVKEKVPLSIVQELVGHSNIKITEGYTHVQVDDKVAVVKDFKSI